MQIAPVVGSLAGATAVLAWRMRESTRPVTVRKIVIPPLGMSTGFCMFFVPAFRFPLLWGLSAFLFGALLLSYPLVKTTQLVRRGDVIWMQRSRAFIGILLGLFAVRFAAHEYVGHYISPMQTAALFFVLAFGMITRWRAWMYLRYRVLLASESLTCSPRPAS